MKPSDSAQHIDYFTFSAHKMYAPFGVGILIGPRTLFEKGIPEYVGDRAVKNMSFDSVKWADPPLKEEAGTPNIIGVIALVEAIKTLTELGMDNVQKYEGELLQYAVQRLRQIQDLHLYIDSSASGIGIIPFNLKGIPHDILSRILADEAGIITRNGEMNATIYVNKLLTAYPDATQNYIAGTAPSSPGVVRTSFALYNTKEEIDIFIDLLLKISKDKKLYVEKCKI